MLEEGGTRGTKNTNTLNVQAHGTPSHNSNQSESAFSQRVRDQALGALKPCAAGRPYETPALGQKTQQGTLLALATHSELPILIISTKKLHKEEQLRTGHSYVTLRPNHETRSPEEFTTITGAGRYDIRPPRVKDKVGNDWAICWGCTKQSEHT